MSLDLKTLFSNSKNFKEQLQTTDPNLKRQLLQMFLENQDKIKIDELSTNAINSNTKENSTISVNNNNNNNSKFICLIKRK
jgi:hypothetical protein